MFASLPEESSLDGLLEGGIAWIRQGNYVGGMVLLVLAREILSHDQVHFATVIDAFLDNHRSYLQAQEDLFLASRRFAESEAEQQKLLLAVEQLLPTLRREIGGLSWAPVEEQRSLNGQSNQQSLTGDYFLPKKSSALLGLYFTCFGRFEVKRSGRAIALCRNRSGQAILRYLVSQPGYRASIDSLMGVFWPENPPEVARRKLQIAVSAVRSSLNNGYSSDAGRGYILCTNESYQLNPAVTIQTDVDEFLSLWEAGQQANAAQAAALFERACNLWTGQFLVEDLYADWSFIRREQLSRVYLAMCHALADHYLEAGHYEGAAKWANTVLKENRCDETAYRQLMRISLAQGRRSEALRQYQLCERVLAEELAVQPMPETVHLLQTILICEHSPEKSENRAKIERK